MPAVFDARVAKLAPSSSLPNDLLPDARGDCNSDGVSPSARLSDDSAASPDDGGILWAHNPLTEETDTIIASKAHRGRTIPVKPATISATPALRKTASTTQKRDSQRSTARRRPATVDRGRVAVPISSSCSGRRASPLTRAPAEQARPSRSSNRSRADTRHPQRRADRPAARSNSSSAAPIAVAPWARSQPLSIDRRSPEYAAG